MVLELPIFHEMHMLWIDVPKDILQRFDSATDRIDQQRDLELHGSLSQKCWSFVALPDTSLPQIRVIRYGMSMCACACVCVCVHDRVAHSSWWICTAPKS